MSADATTTATDDRIRFGMWVFLASEIMFFGPVFFTYLVARYQLPEGFAEASRSTNLVLGTLNTAILLTSSLTVALALESAKKKSPVAVRRALELTIFLGVCFLAVKGGEYIHDWHSHLVPGANFHLSNASHQQAAELFYFVYFSSTLLHGLHLCIGIGLVAYSRLCFARPVAHADTRRLEIIGLYWHFVDIIWIFLFPALYLIGRAQ